MMCETEFTPKAAIFTHKSYISAPKTPLFALCNYYYEMEASHYSNSGASSCFCLRCLRRDLWCFRNLPQSPTFVPVRCITFFVGWVLLAACLMLFYPLWGKHIYWGNIDTGTSSLGVSSDVFLADLWWKTALYTAYRQILMLFHHGTPDEV